jgi:pilus assembly protein CpaC
MSNSKEVKGRKVIMVRAPRFYRYSVLLSCTAGLLIQASAFAQTATRTSAVVPKKSAANLQQPVDIPPSPMAEIEMFVGETRVLPQPNAGRLAVGNGGVINAAVLDDKEILLIANAPGVSSLHVWTRDGRNSRLRIQVMPGETSRISKEIVEMLAGIPNLTAKPIGDKVVVDGKNLTEEHIFKIEELSKRYPQVVNLTAFQKSRPFEKMVLMDVKVIEIAKNRARDLGIRWNASAAGPQFGVMGDVHTNSSFRLPAPADSGITFPEGQPYPVSPFKTYFGIASAITSRIALAESKGEAVTLADPQLAARSGKSATFLVGGEIPYQVIGQNNQTGVVFKKYGVELEIEPTALDSGAIHSRIKAKVSEPDSATNNSVSAPALRSREAETWFNVRAGETMVLAGLLQKRGGETVDQVPGLGSIPILGYLFKGKRKEVTETELMIFVTPTIVDPNTVALNERKEKLQDRVQTYLNPPEPPPAPPTPEVDADPEQYRGGQN